MRSIFLALVAVVLMVAPTVAQLSDDTFDRRLDQDVREHRAVIQSLFAKELEKRGPLDELGAVVQFRPEFTASERERVKELGIRIERDFHSINGFYGIGPKVGWTLLANEDGVFWMEYNQQMVDLMHDTTTVINATRTWATTPTEGVHEFPNIDGEGVTAFLVDTGVDAGHPDLDYGSKTIINLKSDFDNTYTEVEDSDTGSGHGTHCAGTILGNGDASAGMRQGVAPGARLGAISTGEHFLQNTVGALEWVYEHTRPYNNPYNIRVVSNSWGGSAGEYDPNDAITQVAQRITYENNVVVVFAAGNSGENDHDGSVIETSVYGNTPCIVEVAAALHGGDGLAYFSSRGQADLNQTWPDVAAPGWHIWATEARKTQITAMRQKPADDRSDVYYMSISGTSMATPHISGVVALLWQAAPSMRVMNISENSMNTDPTYWNDTNTRIHEVEWILETTSRYMEPGNSSDPDPRHATDNGVPGNFSISDTHFDHKYDYAQGYGLVDVDKAVMLALTLEEMREKDQGATVYDAWHKYLNISETRNVTRKTNTLTTNWSGEWGYLVDQRNSLVTNHPHEVYIPNETQSLTMNLAYKVGKQDGNYWQWGELSLTIDSNGDGSPEWTGATGYSNSGSKEVTVDAASIGTTGISWSFNVEGNYIGTPRIRMPNYMNDQYNEILVEYNIGVQLLLALPADGYVVIPEQDLHAKFARLEFGPPGGESGNVTGGGISMTEYFYNLSKVWVTEEAPPGKTTAAGPPWWIVLLVILAIVGTVFYLWRRSRTMMVDMKRTAKLVKTAAKGVAGGIGAAAGSKDAAAATASVETVPSDKVELVEEGP